MLICYAMALKEAQKDKKPGIWIQSSTMTRLAGTMLTLE